MAVAGPTLGWPWDQQGAAPPLGFPSPNDGSFASTLLSCSTYCAPHIVLHSELLIGWRKQRRPSGGQSSALECSWNALELRSLVGTGRGAEVDRVLKSRAYPGAAPWWSAPLSCTCQYIAVAGSLALRCISPEYLRVAYPTSSSGPIPVTPVPPVN